MSIAQAPSSHAEATETKLTGTLVAFGIAALIIGLMASATLLFGLPGLSMVALALVPVIYVTLLILTFGK
ncbi:MAG: hypothetical protein N4A70_02290 [Pelagimonas sp.]|nr:hypothetical protein [Pelagimonas sp.]